MKKSIALLLAVLMVAALFVGCGKPEEPAPVAPAQSSAPADQPAEKQIVKIMCVSSNNDGSETMEHQLYESEDPRMVQFRKDMEALGIELQCEFVDAVSLQNTISTRMALGQDLPDLISYQQGDEAAPTIKQWGLDGLVWNVGELCDLYDEDGSIKAFYDKYGLWNADAADDGNRYWFSYCWANGTRYNRDIDEYGTGFNTYNFLIRKDWVEAVGEEFKDVYTLDEYFELCKKIRDNDANGNGVADEILTINVDRFNVFATAMGLHKDFYGYYYGENKVENTFFMDGFEDYIMYMKKYYDEGLLDMTFFDQMNWGNEALAQNKVIGYWCYSSEGQESYVIDDPNANYQPVIIDVDGDITNGFYQQTDNPGPKTYYQFFVPKAAENPEGVVKLMDYCHTYEFNLLNSFGTPDSGTYELIGPNNDVVAVSPRTWGDGDSAYFLWNCLPCPQVLVEEATNELKDPSEYASLFAMDREAFCLKLRNEWLVKYGIADCDKNYGANTPEYADFEANKEATLKAYEKELLYGLIDGSKSLDDMDTYRQELIDLGALEQVELLQARLDKLS